MASCGFGIYYRPQRSCGQGYVFTRVCDSVHRAGYAPCPGVSACGVSACGVSARGVSAQGVSTRGVSTQGDVCPGGVSAQGGLLGRPPDTINERPVRLLLECILVLMWIWFTMIEREHDSDIV